MLRGQLECVPGSGGVSRARLSASTSSPPRAHGSSSRVVALDAARVLATLGIVWVHVAEIQGQDERLSTLGRFGTSFYILAAIFLAVRGHLHRPQTRTVDVARRRAKRLLIPFVLWSVIYGVFYFATMYPQGHPVSVITRYWGPLFGTAPHLWFLPFAFFAGVLASFFVPRLLRFPGRVLLVMGPLVTLGAYVLVYGYVFPRLDQPAITAARIHRLSRWVEEMPAVVGAIFGFAIYGKYLPELSRIGPSRRRLLVVLGAVGFVLTEVAYALTLEKLGAVFWNRVRFFSNIAGAFWMLTFLAAWQGKITKRLAPLGSATYFAYLVHQMVLDSVKRQLTFLPGYGSLGFAIVSTLGVFGVSVGLGLFVSRVRILRWLSP